MKGRGKLSWGAGGNAASLGPRSNIYFNIHDKKQHTINHYLSSLNKKYLM